ncbi:MAG: hypothetical protein J3K34DRAFT_84973 [Monoraphidium minutum]|nr:MAG: hypothetical protein J3K34DRAFT_84973 [Monoraphidium minutum]
MTRAPRARGDGGAAAARAPAWRRAPAAPPPPRLYSTPPCQWRSRERRHARAQQEPPSTPKKRPAPPPAVLHTRHQTHCLTAPPCVFLPPPFEQHLLHPRPPHTLFDPRRARPCTGAARRGLARAAVRRPRWPGPRPRPSSAPGQAARAPALPPLHAAPAQCPRASAARAARTTLLLTCTRPPPSRMVLPSSYHPLCTMMMRHVVQACAIASHR